MAKLKIVWPDNREQEFEIKKDTIVIGRTGDNDLKLSDTGISRKQCKIEGSPGNYSIVDLDSKNGTMVNGANISTSQLKHNDTIVIGRISLIFIDEESAEKDAAAVDADADAAEKEAGAVETDEEVPTLKEGDSVCPSCGAVVRGADVLCVKCGTFIKKDGAGTGVSSIKDNWIAWVLLLIVLGVLIVGGIVLFSNGDDNQSVSSGQDLEKEILQIIRSVKTPTEGTYGELFDNLNISNSDIDIDSTRLGDDPELKMYKVVLTFVTEDGIQNMVFHVDLQSEEAEDKLDDPQFTFTKFL
jgi:pSer/pThr/pTyr-binding forkhead associated (FHA) protein